MASIKAQGHIVQADGGSADIRTSTFLSLLGLHLCKFPAHLATKQPQSLYIWEIAKGGGQNVSCDFGVGGTYKRARPPKLVLEASDSGICLVCALFL